MDCLHIENEEIGFDDNGLQHAFMLASSDCNCDDGTEDNQLSHSDAIPTERDEELRINIQIGESKSYCAESVKDESGPFSQVLNPDQKDPKEGLVDHLELAVWHTANTEGAERGNNKSAKRLGDVKAKQDEFRSDRSANDKGSCRGITDLEIAENVYMYLKRALRLRESEVIKAKTRSELSGKEGGGLKGIIDQEKHKAAENLIVQRTPRSVAVEAKKEVVRSQLSAEPKSITDLEIHQGSENEDDKRNTGSGEVESMEANFRSELSAKDGGGCKTIKVLKIQDGTENAENRIANTLNMVEVKEAKNRSELSAKDGGSLTCVTDLTLQGKATNYDDKRTLEQKEVAARLAKFRSELSAKDGGCLEIIRDQQIQEESEHLDDASNRRRLSEVEVKQAKVLSLDLLPSKNVDSLVSVACLERVLLLSSILGRTCATMSWQFLVSLTVGILLLIPSAGVEGGLTSVPVNTLAVVGKTARLNCSTDSNQTVYWTRTPAGYDEQQWLYYGIDGFHSNNADGRFSIDKDEATGRFDIIIADVQPKDAGQYSCIDDSGLGLKTSAELVISAHINCNSLIPSDGVMGDNVFGIEQDFIHFSCSLNYTGNISPVLKWSWPGYEIQSAERTVSGVVTSSVAATLKLSPTTDHNNVKFKCKADLDGTTQSAIDDELTWESETVIVRHAVRTSNLMDVCPGVESILACNPPCSYNFVAKNNECQCHYTYNHSRTQQKYQTASDPILCSKEKDTFRIALIAIAVIFLILFVTAMCVMVCYLKKYKTRSRAMASRESSQSNSEAIKSGDPMLESA